MYFDWLASERGVTHADIYDEKADLNDLKRLATAEEVADAALLLASPLASAVTGVCLDACSGSSTGERPPVRERDSVGTFEDLHAAATRMTGLDDFGGDEYLEPLQVLLHSYAHSAGLPVWATRCCGRSCAAPSRRVWCRRRASPSTPRTPTSRSSARSS